MFSAPPEMELQLLESGVLNGGLVSQFDPKNIEPNQLVQATNVDTRDDRTQRSFGFTLFTPAKPNSNKVLQLVPYNEFNGTVRLVRFTRNSLHLWSAGSWTAITGAALSGTDQSMIGAVEFNNRFFFGNQVDALQEINFVGPTYAAAGNAPKFKYWCSFANRIIGASLYHATTPNPILVGWSGDLNPTEWNNLVDISAGSTPLIDQPRDFSDELTGVFAFSDLMVLPREHTIWVATRQPSATSPFYFYVEVKTLGCDSPQSITPIPNGLIFYSKRFNNVYVYTIGNPTPLAIADSIRDELAAAIANNADGAQGITSCYDSKKFEYILAIPIGTSTEVLQYKFNLQTKGWTKNTVQNVSFVDLVEFTAQASMIDDLVGTIDQLVGTIDELSPNTPDTRLFYGLTDGDLLIDSPSVDTVNGVARETVIESKEIQVPFNVTFVTELHLDVLAVIASTFSVYFSKDGGVTYNLYKTVTISGPDMNKRKRLTFKKNIRCEQFRWKLTSSSGLFNVYRFDVYHYPYGVHHRAD
jgi:hypothetical protein